ncbi:MAG: transcriptional antiterminator, Rof [Gammaproteobacteria bacterium]|nr:transcriptional antiterminator, Rof [Gammaproteobacteria bacterium]
MSDDYTPIGCDRYSELELHIMHRDRLRTAWRDAEGNLHQEVLSPQDLQTREGAEYLLAETLTGAAIELRLDRILRIEPL